MHYIISGDQVAVPLSNSQTLYIHACQGTLVGHKSHTKTEISSQGPRIIDREDRYVRAPKITSKSTTYHDLFIKAPDGSEDAFRVTDNVYPASLEGHTLTIFKGILDGKETIFSVINHTTGKKAVDEEYLEEKSHGSATAGCLSILAMLTSIFMFVGGASQQKTFIAFIGLIAFPFSAVLMIRLAFKTRKSGKIRREKIYQAFEKSFSLANEIYASKAPPETSLRF
jgi:hypothetical protein